MPAGAHEQYLDFITRGAMLERGDGELQRELSHLLSALVQLQPLLRNLQQEVRAKLCREPMPAPCVVMRRQHVCNAGEPCTCCQRLCSCCCATCSWRWVHRYRAGIENLMYCGNVISCAHLCSSQWRCSR